MIVKSYIKNKYIIIEKMTEQEYYTKILLEKYNKNVIIPKVNQINVIKNKINYYY